MDNHITIHNMSFAFPGKMDSPVLSNVSMRVTKGEFVSLIGSSGSSGSGKSTLFKLLAGLLEPTHGTIEIPWVREGERLGHVAYMPQKDLSG
ncbi:ATP-binding cassette domain-containing protein [Paenibacillus vandeheii]